MIALACISTGLACWVLGLSSAMRIAFSVVAGALSVGYLHAYILALLMLNPPS